MLMEMEKEILTLDPLLDRRVEEAVADPSDYMQQSLEKINRLFQKLYYHYGVTVEEFNAFLRKRDPRLLHAIASAWLAMDNGVYGLYQEQLLDLKTYKEWKNRVAAWRRLVSAAVQLYRVHQRPTGSDVVFHLPKAA